MAPGYFLLVLSGKPALLVGQNREDGDRQEAYCQECGNQPDCQRTPGPLSPVRRFLPVRRFVPVRRQDPTQITPLILVPLGTTNVDRF